MRSPSFEALLLLGSAIAPAARAAESSSRPRGVGPEFAKYYKDPNNFACISHPSIVLPVSRLNDDYCDCPDGSDEPGTSACAYLSPLSPRTAGGVALSSEPSSADPNTTLPGFYCKNKGHIPSYVPFVSVNDGVCDYELCCDGSDEWEGVGGAKCPDRCKEIGAEWRKQDEARQKSLNAAREKRKELVAEAARMKREVEDRLQTLATELEGHKIKAQNMEKELQEVEAQEKARIAKGGKKGGKFAVLAGLAKQRVDELREALTRVRGERDASREKVKELEAILSRFSEEYNPNFNDEGVKRAVNSWLDYAASKTAEENAAQDRDLDEFLKPEIEGLNWDDFEGDAESDVDVLYSITAYLPAPLRSFVDTQLRSLRAFLIDNGVLPGQDADSDSVSETKAVQEARDRLHAAERDRDNGQKEIEKHKNDLTTDYGPDGVFRALKSRCTEVDSGEYTYEHCFLSKTMQKPKKGGAHVNMGNFAGFTTVTVDEEVGPDGRGLGSGERWAIKYENGQHCWNGPNRMTTVILGCAENDEIWKVREEEKCVYRMEVGTPAVCGPGAVGGGNGSAKQEDGKKDEL
ncbi:glucosidase II beta subunit-like protein-domain-containing protein [Phyllosticta citricarpa]|uniref:Glucosidase 2 subunit beta n=2 Tax=Phyllosticta TaxID=121621 RepID=A0ABR1MNR0_9PEZI